MQDVDRNKPRDTGCRQEQAYSIQDVNKNKSTVRIQGGGKGRFG